MNQQLFGRQADCSYLDEMLTALSTGESRVLVVRGAAGVGKSALLGYAASAATGIRVLRAAGVESEMELAFAALHQLCAPLLDRIAGLPVPQRAALETVFGLREGAPPDNFLVGLAVLSLLADASAERPLLCVVDDVQWFDRGSARVLGFVARRLLAESIGLLFSTRDPGPELRGLPDLALSGLRDADAHALLDSVTHARLDRRIRDRIVAETRGNPLALIELPHGLSGTRMAGGLGLLSADMLPGRIEQSFLNRVAELPEPTRLLLLVAAAEPEGDLDLVRLAAERLGVTLAAALTGGTDGLLTIDARVTFRHPLVRSAVYQSARAEDRRAAHLALAEVTDPVQAPDRRAWHLASAAAGPDEAVATQLELAAGRAQARGGIAAAAAFLRSVALTADPGKRADRMLAAAEASLRAGEFDDVRRLLDLLRSPSLDGLQRGRAGMLEGQASFLTGGGSAAIGLLLTAAEHLEPANPQLARESYLHAWNMANIIADRDAILAVSRAVRNLPAPAARRPMDMLLDGVALLVTEGRAAAAAILTETSSVITDIPVTDVLRWGLLSTAAPVAIWDLDTMLEVSARQVRVVRDAGALQRLPESLINLGYALSWAGDFAGAAAAIEEGDIVAGVTGSPLPPYITLRLLALRGQEPECLKLIATTMQDATGYGSGRIAAGWAGAVLCNGLARYPEAMRFARAAEEKWDPWHAVWLLPELIEAATRTGELAVARAALEQLVEATGPYSADYPAGLEARNRALLADEPGADDLYREAVARLSRTRMRPDLARAHLLYGEWLRRRRQRVEAREHLRTAYEMFVSIGMEAFAERARRELLATGETVRRRTVEASKDAELTPQERQIAQLVRDGLSNPEVGARLFLSPRTVEWHLRKIFAKLSVTSRKQLREVLPSQGAPQQ